MVKTIEDIKLTKTLKHTCFTFLFALFILVVCIYYSNCWFWWLSFIVLLFPNCLLILSSAHLDFEIRDWPACQYHVCRHSLRREKVLPGKAGLQLVLPSLGPPLHAMPAAPCSNALSLRWPRALLLPRERGRHIFLLWTAWHSLGEGALLSLLASPCVAPHWVHSRSLFLPLPLLTLSLSWDCSCFVKKNDCSCCRLQVSHFHPIWTVSKISYNISPPVHLEDPFWFCSIAIVLLLNNVFCVISRSFEWEWEAVATGALWKHCVQSISAPSCVKIHLGLHGD